MWDVRGLDVTQYESLPDGVYIHKTATVAEDVTLGYNVIIGPGAVIGKDGFGYEREDTGRWVPKPHTHSVVIMDDVHVGANVCIDRGSWRDTYIGTGCRVDNLVHVAHNVHLEDNCVLVAGALVAGSVRVGTGSWIGLGAKVNQRVTLGEGCFIGSGAVVTKNVPPRRIFAGVPARDFGPVTADIY